MSDNLDDSRRYTFQTSVVCDGCEGIRDVHSFCLDCHGNLCNACKERHPSVRLTKNHTVLPRGHPAVIELRLAKTKRKIPCRKHPDNDYVTYCIKCNIPCCAMCMIEDHAGHDVAKFEDVEEDVRQALTKYGENLEKELLPQALKITTELKQRKSTSTKQLQKHKDQVRRRVSDLQKKVAGLGREAEDKLDEMYNTEVETLDDLIRTSEEKSKLMSELVANCKQTVDKANAAEMSLLLADSPTDLAELLPKVALPASTVFSESSFEIHSYNEVVGEVKEDKRKTLFDPTNSEIQLLKPEVKTELAAPDRVASASPPAPKSFTPDMIQTSKEGEFSTSIIPYSMARTDNDEVWIYGYGDDYGSLALYDEAGNQKQTMEMTFNINDISLTASQDIIATDYFNERIVRISRSSDVTSLRSTTPLIPCGICINDRQQLVVGLSKVWRVLSIKLVVYSSDGGSVVQEMEKDEDNKALFKDYIHRVRQNGNGDYVVIDGNTLVCLTRDGSLRWRHKGRIVTGVECDGYCNVIYCDNDGVTMLDTDGGLIRQLLTSEKDGVVCPKSISLDRHGRLWIGLSGQTVKIWKYLK